MGYDNLRKRTDEFVKDKESYDYEFEDFSQESEKLNNAKTDFLKLDSDVISAFGEVESEFDASAEILDKEKEKLDTQKEELSDTIGKELETLDEADDKLSSLASKKYGEAFSKAKDKSKDYINQLEKMLDDIGSAFDDRTSAGGGGAGSTSTSSKDNFSINESDQINDSQESADESKTIVPLDVFLDSAVPNNGPQIVPSNAHPVEDIMSAFDFADKNYDKNSDHWQEVANRQLETLDGEIKKLSDDLESLKNKKNDCFDKLTEYVQTNNFSREQTQSDPAYAELSRIYVAAADEYNKANARHTQMVTKRNEISPHIDSRRRTVFVGRGNSDFLSSYDHIITEPQGHTVPGFGGTCGINHTVSEINIQLGSDYGEEWGIKFAVDNGLCETGKSYGQNGGTDAMGRKDFLNSFGLTFDRVEGARNTGHDISLDDVADRFMKGECAGIMLRAQDLRQPEIASRKRVSGFSKEIREYNRTRYYSNHATTIAGFSYDINHRVTGVWINDTGPHTGVNRVFIDREKFNQMQRNTDGFAVEFTRKAA